MRKNGFTLVEILIAITIVSILATIGLTTYQGVSGKARDGIRKDDLRQFATALEFYFQKNGKYIEGSGDCSDTTNFYVQIAPFLNEEPPKDPSRKDADGNPERYCYSSIGNGQAFRLFTKLENCEDTDFLKLKDGLKPLCSEFNYSIASEGTDLALAITPDGGGVVIDPESGLPTKRVFVTSDEYLKNGNLGGVDGANLVCQQAADNAQLGGVWKAWISTTTSSPANRPDFTKNVKYALVSQTGRVSSSDIIATSWNDLIDSSDLIRKINRDQTGRQISSLNVWTGTQSSGASFTGTESNCDNWTTNAVSGKTGIQGSPDKRDGGWTNNNLQSCNNEARLYCFE